MSQKGYYSNLVNYFQPDIIADFSLIILGNADWLRSIACSLDRCDQLRQSWFEVRQKIKLWYWVGVFVYLGVAVLLGQDLFDTKPEQLENFYLVVLTGFLIASFFVFKLFCSVKLKFYKELRQEVGRHKKVGSEECLRLLFVKLEEKMIRDAILLKVGVGKEWEIG